ncbi:MAG TPA: SWIB/MDM2 domain-containing protein [Chthoniobacteraceae bacterium]|nr:SWIB/MDM2 domain-containing protein [Chthoniobacteraceae bacterium]
MSEENPELLKELRDLIASKAGVPPTWKPNETFAESFQPDDALASIVGSNPLTRSELARLLWNYIREHNLQDSGNRWMINADNTLAGILGGRKRVGAIELMNCVFKHVK